jgi:hypothetical protein
MFYTYALNMSLENDDTCFIANSHTISVLCSCLYPEGP